MKYCSTFYQIQTTQSLKNMDIVFFLNRKNTTKIKLTPKLLGVMTLNFDQPLGV